MDIVYKALIDEKEKINNIDNYYFAIKLSNYQNTEIYFFNKKNEDFETIQDFSEYVKENSYLNADSLINKINDNDFIVYNINQEEEIINQKVIDNSNVIADYIICTESNLEDFNKNLSWLIKKNTTVLHVFVKDEVGDVKDNNKENSYLSKKTNYLL